MSKKEIEAKIEVKELAFEKFINPHGELPIDEIRLAKRSERIVLAEPKGPKIKHLGIFSRNASKTEFHGYLFHPDYQRSPSYGIAQGEIGNCWLLAALEAIEQQKYGLLATAGTMRDMGEPYPAYKEVVIVDKQPKHLEKGIIAIKKNKDGSLNAYWQNKSGSVSGGPIKKDEAAKINQSFAEKKSNDPELIFAVVEPCLKYKTMPTLGDELKIPSDRVVVRYREQDSLPKYLLLKKSTFNSMERAQSVIHIQILEKAFAHALYENKEWSQLDEANTSENVFNKMFFNEDRSRNIAERLFFNSSHKEEDIKRVNDGFIREIKLLVKNIKKIKSIESIHPAILMLFPEQKLAKRFVELLIEDEKIANALIEKGHILDIGSDIKPDVLIGMIIEKFQEKQTTKETQQIISILRTYQKAVSEKDFTYFQQLDFQKWVQEAINNGWPMVYETKEFKDNQDGLNGEGITSEGFIGGHAFAVDKFYQSSYADVSRGIYEKIFLLETKDYPRDDKEGQKILVEQYGVNKILIIKTKQGIYLAGFDKNNIWRKIEIKPEQPLYKTIKGLTLDPGLQPLAGIKDLPIRLEIAKALAPIFSKPTIEAKDQKTISVLKIKNPWGSTPIVKISSKGIEFRSSIDEEQALVRGSTLVKLGSEIHSMPEYLSGVSFLPLEKAVSLSLALIKAKITFNDQTPQIQSQRAMDAMNEELEIEVKPLTEHAMRLAAIKPEELEEKHRVILPSEKPLKSESLIQLSGHLSGHSSIIFSKKHKSAEGQEPSIPLQISSSLAPS